MKDGKIKTIEEIFLFSIPIKEPEIVEHFIPDLKDEVMSIKPVQKQTTAGQKTRFRASAVVGNSNGLVGLGSKCSSEVANAIRGAIQVAKTNIVPIRRGYWGSKFGMPHTVPCKVSGKCGSVRIRLIPAPRGTGLVTSPNGKKMLAMAGIRDCYTSSRGHTRTQFNTVRALFFALRSTYGFLSPDLWAETAFMKSPYQEHTDYLAAIADDKSKKTQKDE